MILKILFLSFLSFGSCHKILMFSPTASKSHMISQGRIADELAKAGHEVVNFEPDFLDLDDKFVPCKLCRRWPVTGLNNQNYKDIQSDLSSHIFEESSLWSTIFNSQPDPHQTEYNNLCEEIVSNKELISQLRAEKFDAIFTEHVHLCGIGLGEVLNIPHRFWIASCSMGISMRNILGIPTPVSFHPFMTHLDATPAPIWQRAMNLLLQFTQIRDELVDNRLTTEMYRKYYGQSFPTIESIASNSGIVFVSTDELLEIQAPILSNVVHIGGLGASDNIKSLDQKFANEMEKGEDGVILFSLGTIANTTSLPPQIMQNFIELTKKFEKYHFIIKVDKYDKNTFNAAKGLNNVYVTDWVPQLEILAHPRLKTFITHAGYNSLMEAARQGVPIITIPFMFDQPRNSRAVARKGWGISRDKNQLANEPEAIENAIREIIDNDIYKQKATRLKNLIRSKPQSASERLVKTTQWVIDNGGIMELQFEGRHMDTITYYNIDVFITLFLIVAFLFALLRVPSYIRKDPKQKSE